MRRELGKEKRWREKGEKEVEWRRDKEGEGGERQRE